MLNDDGVGTVTVFRVYPDGVDTWTIKERERTDPAAREELLQHNDYRRLLRYLHDRAMRGAGVHLSMTDCYRETDYGECKPGAAFTSTAAPAYGRAPPPTATRPRRRGPLPVPRTRRRRDT